MKRNNHNGDILSTVDSQPKLIVLPLIALCFDLVPVLMSYISSRGIGLPSYAFLLIVFSPIVGLVIGVVALSYKKQLSTLAKALAILAIAIPICAIAFIIIAFIGVVTGLIPLM